MFYTFDQIVVDNIQSVVRGTTPSLTINLTQNTDISTGGSSILTAPVAITDTTTGQNLTSYANPTIPANRWVILLTSASSGTVESLTVTIKYTQ